MRKLIMVLMAVFTFLIVIGLSGQGNAGKIYGCYQEENGQLRMLDDYDECLKSEEPIPLSEVLNEIEEYCFAIELEDGDLLGTVKLGLSHIGDGNYIVSGKAYYNSLQVIQGNAEIDGNNILLAVNHISKGDTSLSTSSSRILIDRSTFNGTSEFVTHNLNYSDMSLSRDYGTASLTNISCPEGNILLGKIY
jgi:hypothetical protein